jgi:hypothetical protein
VALGADAPVSYDEPGWTAEVMRLTGGRGVDVLIESKVCCLVTQIGKRQVGYWKKVGRFYLATIDRCQFHRQNKHLSA